MFTEASLASISTKAGTSIAAGAVVVGAGAVVVGTRTGASIAAGASIVGKKAERFVCGDERALQYHAKQQEPISPMHESISSPVAAAYRSPTNVVLEKYSLNQLVCGGFKCSECVHDMAVGAIDIICLGYCDACLHLNGNDDVMSPHTLDTPGHTFTFDSVDSHLGSDSSNLHVDLKLDNASRIQDRMIMLQSIELTEDDFVESINAHAPTATEFTPRSPKGRRSPFFPKAVNSNNNILNENIAVEHIHAREELTTKPRQKMSFFGRKKVKETTQEAQKKSGSADSLGCATTKVKNTNKMMLEVTRA